MQVTFFWNDGIHQQLYDRRVIQFNATPDLPAPPQELIREHYKQAVLANMKGAGEPRDLDFDPEEDARRMTVLEEGSGQKWFETFMADKLAPHEGTSIDLKP